MKDISDCVVSYTTGAAGAGLRCPVEVAMLANEMGTTCRVECTYHSTEHDGRFACFGHGRLVG
jgi:hypothetical protein